MEFWQPLPDWPDQGMIEFKNVFLQYHNDCRGHALDDVNLKIYGGEKIGIVGRTGAGKSSLLAALFRLVELDGGKILVDDVDIANLNLAALR